MAPPDRRWAFRAQRDDEVTPDLPAEVGTVANALPLPATLLELHDLRWHNAGNQHGFVFGWTDLAALIANLGSGAAWAWIVVDDLASGYFAQACGNPEIGVIVEVANPIDHVQMVVPEGSHPWPRHDVGSYGFSFRAAEAESLDLATAVAVVRCWLEFHAIPMGMSLRNGWRRTVDRRALR